MALPETPEDHGFLASAFGQGRVFQSMYPKRKKEKNKEKRCEPAQKKDKQRRQGEGERRSCRGATNNQERAGR